jgi:hypothetical protein
MTTDTTQLAQLQRTNARLRTALVGIAALAVGLALGGFTQPDEDEVEAYVATDGTIYKLYESGAIQYLRIEDDPPRSANGIFTWGDIRFDQTRKLPDRP